APGTVEVAPPAGGAPMVEPPELPGGGGTRSGAGGAPDPGRLDGWPSALAVSRRPWHPLPQATLLLAVSRMRLTVACGDSPVLSRRAAVPETWGAAIDVPARYL